ncbi:helix-turn-helix domain-containing protein [Chelatococcus sambhunathii]|uniref:Helix-turn-helix domain-containing protein n=2 Tax=Chelatococcus sambhunathii TaxID=363953 RepID=A0ABU1DHM0_9HYPH|nr:helix-turn-helix domain-containing protein [Chelatococcus sambhunathii]
MNIRPIHTEDDYEWALSEVSLYFENEPEIGTPDADRFDVLSDLIAAYEARNLPLPAVDPIDALKAFMESAGKSQSDLAELFGSRSRASEVLNLKRALTLEMVHKLNRRWGVPAELLIAPYALAA